MSPSHREKADRKSYQLVDDDRARKAYFQRFYDIRAELPTHYDRVINRDALSPEQAVTAIVSVAQTSTTV